MVVIHWRVRDLIINVIVLFIVWFPETKKRMLLVSVPYPKQKTTKKVRALFGRGDTRKLLHRVTP